ncbi:MAG: bifunctional 3-deoxy-7-phosphoheptulonate synthase/chorismate mutase type II [Planctomycetaceae bacterium]|jgi:chorismate mutase|nr:bifunctional 3-deoxy-7-phosphoheptulonate synthase/chorismate mutase type II [Planctomycetaceae bacterium]
MDYQLESIVLSGIDPVRPVVIAGPCSAETEEQVITTASAIASCGVRIFRAGIWKPRTKPGGFEGVGADGLNWLKRVKRETGMYTAIEVATREHVFAALKAGIDILWIGARTTVNPFAVQDIADALNGMDIPVLIKNPVNPDIELWIGAIERIHRAGIRRLAAVHRGFSSYDNKGYRNTPHWQVPIELRRRIPNLPILCDPSHIAGKRDLIHTLSQQAMDLKFDGLLIETHNSPESAWSDAQQQITPEQLHQLLSALVIRDMDRPSKDFAELRSRIDNIDDQLLSLLAARMQVAVEIGLYKKANNMPILQSTRYGQIIEQKSNMAKSMKLNPDFIKGIMQAIHEESIRQQIEVVSE